MSVKFIDAAEEYKRNKDLKADDVRALQQWAEKQPHLPPISEMEMILFLHSCFFSIERAKTTIDIFYTVKTHFPEMAANRDPCTPAFDTLMDVMLFTVLPRTPANHRVIYCKFMPGTADRFVHADQIKCFDMNLMLSLMEDGTADGMVILLDLDQLSFAHFLKFNVMALKKFFYYLQEGLPVRVAGIHFINVVAFMDKVMALMKPFMKQELMDALYFYQSNAIDDLFKFIPPECLPQELGGTYETVPALQERMKERLKANAAYFIAAEKLVADESKRQGKATDVEEIFGVDGTFKKLDID